MAREATVEPNWTCVVHCNYKAVRLLHGESLVPTTCKLLKDKGAHVGCGSGVKWAAVESSVINWLAGLGEGGLHDRMSRWEKDEFHLTAHGGSKSVRTKS